MVTSFKWSTSSTSQSRALSVTLLITFSSAAVGSDPSEFVWLAFTVMRRHALFRHFVSFGSSFFMISFSYSWILLIHLSRSIFAWIYKHNIVFLKSGTFCYVARARRHRWLRVSGQRFCFRDIILQFFDSRWLFHV